MLIDAQTLLWSAAALTSDAASTNTYDLGAAYSGGSANGSAIDPSVGEPLCAVINVGVAADNTTGDETYAFEVIQSANADLSSPDVLIRVPFTNAQVTAGLLAAGSNIIIPIPSGSVTKRYLGLNYDGSGTTPTITVTAWITALSMVQRDKKYYASATVIN